MNITPTKLTHPKFIEASILGRVAAATDLLVPNQALYQAKLNFAVTFITNRSSQHPNSHHWSLVTGHFFGS